MISTLERKTFHRESHEIFWNNCQNVIQSRSCTSNSPALFRPAILHHMQTATPNVQRSASIEDHFQEFVDKMEPPPGAPLFTHQGCPTTLAKLPNWTCLEVLNAPSSRWLYGEELYLQEQTKETEKPDALEEVKEYINMTAA
ncbi:hypothetical protein BKA70DRAFT_1431289 [Coprinopsis sp. MPI-PUGE-AT-0042]|nr:hypothetical protein BKA70DRAFT_1431289 [Coprinopsis sp. MPI-PUGE-AT-0042]